MISLYATLCQTAYLPIDKAIDRYAALGYKAEVLAQNNQLEQIYRLEKNSELIIVLAGTNQLGDWRTNIFAIPGCYVHPGYSEVATQLITPVRAAFTRSNLPKLKLIGHSKGGAIAALLGYYLWDLKPEGISFGAPRIGSPDFAASYDVNYTRVAFADDIISRLPLHSMGYRHCGKPVIIDNGAIIPWSEAQQRTPFWKLILRLRKSISIHFDYININESIGD